MLSCRETETRFPTEDITGIGYQQGASVKAGLPRSMEADYYIGTNYRLTLPQRALNGQCIRTSPVR